MPEAIGSFGDLVKTEYVRSLTTLAAWASMRHGDPGQQRTCNHSAAVTTTRRQRSAWSAFRMPREGTDLPTRSHDL
jgi:hypothetical protein